MIRTLLLFLIGLLAIAYGFFCFQSIEYNFDTSHFAFSSSSEVERHQEYLEDFGQDEQAISIGLVKESAFDSFDDFQQIGALIDKMYQLEGIDRIIDVQSLTVPAQRGLNVYYDPIFSKDSSAFEEEYRQLFEYDDIREKFVSDDAKAQFFYVFEDSLNPNSELVVELHELLSSSDAFDEFHIMANTAAVEEGEAFLQSESVQIALLATLILLGGLILFLRNFLKLLLILFITLLNVSASVIVMYHLGIPITTLTSAVPSIVAVLSFTDQLHILYHYNQLVEEENDTKLIRRQLFKKIGTPLILTSASNLIGFLIFFFSGGIKQINDLAIAASLGILLSYLISRFLLPEFLPLIRRKTNFRFESSYPKFIEKLSIFLSSHYKKVVGGLLVFSLLMGGLIYSFSRVNMHYYSYENPQMQFEKAAAFYDDYFQGIRDIEVVISSPNKSLLSDSTMKIIDQIENFLIDEYQCRTTYSINTAIKRYNRFKKGGHSKAYKLPETLEQRHIDDIRAVKKDLGLVAILSTDEKKCRIIGSINDIGSYEGTLRNEKLQHFIDGLDKGNLELYIAGKSHIFDQAVNRISSIFILLIGIGILVIGISILLLFRSMLYGIITIWVNLLPLGFALLMMILMGVDLNPASIFLLSILLGVALDDSIYLIGNVYRLSRKGKPNRSMIYESMRSNAFPLFITSLVIGLSFIALSISANHITSSFGLIMSTSLIFAFLTDLICLPALLLWITKD